MLGLLFLLMFLLSASVLSWRVVVTKSRAAWIKVGAAAAVMLTAVGAFLVWDDLDGPGMSDWRSVVALVAACSSSFYLLGWALRRGNKRHRTVSIVAAIIGLVPAIGAIAATYLFHVE